MGTYFSELFSAALYKRNQGRIARQATLFALAIVAAAGCWSLRGWMQGAGYDQTVALFLPLGLFAAGCWAAFRWVHLPKFADFLISVEAEMNKVSWPGRGELWKASLVVILTIFVLAGLLFFYDYVLKVALLPLIEWIFDFIASLFG